MVAVKEQIKLPCYGYIVDNGGFLIIVDNGGFLIIVDNGGFLIIVTQYKFLICNPAIPAILIL